MNLLVYGCYHEIVVDDYIPYDVVLKIPVFAGKMTKNIWPILLEKAWAKINGSYEGIVTGSACDALKFLVPYPIDRDSYNPEKHTEEGMWSKIEDAIEGRYMITCSSRDDKNEITQEDYEKLGLVSNHCYSILGQYCFKYSGKQIKLLKICNPWDKQEWKGDWSDSDTKWNSSLKSKVKFDSKRNGEFYISFDDFLTYLSSYVICKIDPFYDNHSVELSHK